MSYKQGNDWRFLRIRPSEQGYCTVMLSKDGKRKRCTVHRLVAMAFIPNPLNLPIIEHRDDNKQNCRIDNLFWSTPKDNTLHGTYSLRRTTQRR